MVTQARPEQGRPEPGTKWVFDAGNSTVGFGVSHYGINVIRGIFSKVEVNLDFDPDSITSTQVEAKIDATSINTFNPRRDQDLQGLEYLDTQNYPEITFKSKRVEPRGNNKFAGVGDLTIKGITKEVSLDVLFGGLVEDARGLQHAGFTLQTTINRKEFGVTSHTPLPGGGITVADQVDITIDVELRK